MGRRNHQWRERKKPKKGAQKTTVTGISSSPTTVEVIKRKAKERTDTA